MVLLVHIYPNWSTGRPSLGAIAFVFIDNLKFEIIMILTVMKQSGIKEEKEMKGKNKSAVMKKDEK